MRINNISSSVQHWPPPILRAPSDAVCRDTRAGHGLGRHTQPRAHVYARASRSGRQEDETHGREHCLAVAWSEREHANAPDRCWHGARNGAERVAGSTCALRRIAALNGAQPEWRADARRLRYHSIRSYSDWFVFVYVIQLKGIIIIGETSGRAPRTRCSHPAARAAACAPSPAAPALSGRPHARRGTRLLRRDDLRDFAKTLV